MSGARARGADVEVASRDFLLGQGLRAVAANANYRFGELDLVMLDGDTLVFVEVKTRSSPRFGTPAEAVDIRKQRRICGAALQYVSDNAAGDTPARFDVIEVFAENGGFRVRHITDAFSFEAP